MSEIQAVLSTFSWYRVYYYQVFRETWRRKKKTHLCLSPADLNVPWWALQQSKLSQCRRVHLWNQGLFYTIKMKLLPFYIWVTFQVFSKGIHYSALLEIFFLDTIILTFCFGLTSRTYWFLSSFCSAFSRLGTIHSCSQVKA